MFALRTCANIVSFLLVTKNEIGAERVPVWEASEKCSGAASSHRSYTGTVSAAHRRVRP